MQRWGIAKKTARRDIAVLRGFRFVEFAGSRKAGGYRLIGQIMFGSANSNSGSSLMNLVVAKRDSKRNVLKGTFGFDDFRPGQEGSWTRYSPAAAC